MTERERWIVYPLLFLALGAALRDKLIDLTTNKRIICQELMIVDEEASGPQPQRVLAKIGRDKSKTGAKSSATMFINGDLQIIDDDLSDSSQARILATLGRTEPPAGILSEGIIDVHGSIAAGAVNATRFALPGLVLLPVPAPTGGTMLGVVNLTPQSAPKAPNPKGPKPQPPAAPPAAKGGTNATLPPAPASKESPPTK